MVAKAGRTPPVARLVLGGAVYGLLAVWAWPVDQAAFGRNVWLTGLDLVIGCAFAAAAATAPGALRERALMAGVGVTWLAGSVLPQARSLHQALLAIALLAWPSGRLVGLVRWALAAGACVVATEVVPQLAVAVLFAAVAGAALLPHRRAAPYPALAGSAVALGLLSSWWSVHRAEAPSAPVAYEAALLAVAFGFIPASAQRVRAIRSGADRLLREAPGVGLAGLQSALRLELDDDGLEIDHWDTGTGRYRSAEPVRPPFPQQRELSISANDVPLARVRSTSSELEDPATADATSELVRLVVVNEKLSELQGRQVIELEAARSRLVAAAERERQRIAAGLRNEVNVPLRRAAARIMQLPADDPQVRDLLTVAAHQVHAAESDVVELVAGIPSAALGAGRLRVALEAMASRSPLPVRVTVREGTAGVEEAETALFYVCAEALTNAARHAHASLVEVRLVRDGAILELTVHDDGTGRPDPAGSGLQGLADRINAVGGRLQVTGRPGQGTTLVARVPILGNGMPAPASFNGGQGLAPGTALAHQERPLLDCREPAAGERPEWGR